MDLAVLLEQERVARARAEASAAGAKRLQQATAALAGALVPRDVAEVVVAHGVAAFGASVGLVVARADETSSLEVLASAGFPHDVLEPTHFLAPAQGTPVSLPAETGQAVVIHNAAEWERTHGPLRVPPGVRARAWIAQPVVVNQKTIASIGFGFVEHRRFDECDRKFIAALAHLCGQALERSRLYDDVRAAVSREQRRGLRLRAVADAGLAINSAAGRDSILQVMVDQAREIIGAHLVFARTSEERPDSLVFVSPSEKYPMWHRHADELVSWIVSTAGIDPSQPGYIPATDLESRMPQDTFGLSLGAPEQINGLLTVPLPEYESSNTGVFVAVDKMRGEFSDDDEAILTQLAQMAAVAISSARLREQAEEAIQARDAFISSVSHDLKTPIVSIKGLAQMLRRQLTDEGQIDPERFARGLTNIDVAASRMTAMIEDLSNTVRLQLERPTSPGWQTTDLVGIVYDAVREQEQATDGRSIGVEARIPELWGSWDAGRLQRVLANLLSNAVKYSPDDGQIRVIVDREQRDGTLWAVVVVQDHGIGIMEEDLPQIFTRYHRGRNAHKSVSGSGVGLAAVKEIVEQHGGSVHVVSAEGKGSTFTVRLPIVVVQAR